MNLFKPVAAAILLNSTLLVGALTTVSFATSFEAAAAHGCQGGQSRYHGVCMSYRQKASLQRRSAPKEKKCTTLGPMPITGQILTFCE
ncbi:MAG: hypothetical protein WDN31_13885 [Hyphomicrobium sp.]